MTSVSGVTEPATAVGASMVQDAANSLLALDLPSGHNVAGVDDSFYDDWPEPALTPKPRPQRDYATATWLDAVAAVADRPDNRAPAAAVPQRIASINSDDNGLYRMFIGVSP